MSSLEYKIRSVRSKDGDYSVFASLSHSKSTPGSHPCASVVQCKDSWGANYGKAAQQTDSTRNAQFEKHRPREQNGCSREGTSGKVVRSEQRRCIRRIREWEVEKDTLHDLQASVSDLIPCRNQFLTALDSQYTFHTC